MGSTSIFRYAVKKSANYNIKLGRFFGGRSLNVHSKGFFNEVQVRLMHLALTFFNGKSAYLWD